MSRSRHILLLSLLCLACTAASATPLGRLFHTPAERAALDRLRQSGIVEQASAAEPEPMQQIRLDGIVKRSNGRSTTWVNGVARQDHEYGQGVLVLGKPARHGTAALQLPSGRSVTLKAGQTYDVDADQMQEDLGIPATQTKDASR